jgi:hypothetical protein
MLFLTIMANLFLSPSMLFYVIWRGILTGSAIIYPSKSWLQLKFLKTRQAASTRRLNASHSAGGGATAQAGPIRRCPVIIGPLGNGPRGRIVDIEAGKGRHNLCRGDDAVWNHCPDPGCMAALVL